MIVLKNVNKHYPTVQGAAHVLKDINFTLAAGQHVGILGRNGAGKSTLIRLISGAEQPTSGSVHRSMSVSWPLAFSGAFQTALTGLDNYRFICRIYGIEFRHKIDFLKDFSELGLYLNEPVKSYSAGMRARLAFAISMCIEFDCFLVDEVVAVGDARFHAKCHHELFEKRAERARIIVSHDAHYVRLHCDKAAVLHRGQLTDLVDVDEAYERYSALYESDI